MKRYGTKHEWQILHSLTEATGADPDGPWNWVSAEETRERKKATRCRGSASPMV